MSFDGGQRESAYTDEEFQSLYECYCRALGAPADTPFIPEIFHLATAEDPRWEDPYYSKPSHAPGGEDGERREGAC